MRRNPQRSGAFAVALLLLLAGSAPAAAQESPLETARICFERSREPGLSPAQRRVWLERSIAAHPTYKACYELGRVQRDAKDEEAALQSFQSAFDLTDQDPYLAQTAYQIALTHDGMGHAVEARSWLRLSLSFKEYPEVREAWRQLVLREKDRIANAEEILRELDVERSIGIARAALRINFEINEATLDATGHRQAMELGRALTDPAAPRGDTLVLLGHTDRLCPRAAAGAPDCDAFNRELSRRRAASVRELLLTRFDLGVDDVRILGCGREHPMSLRDSDDDHYLNRRVVVMVLDARQEVGERLCGEDARLF